VEVGGSERRGGGGEEDIDNYFWKHMNSIYMSLIHRSTELIRSICTCLSQPIRRRYDT